MGAEMLCPHCGFSNAVGARYCGSCGRDLATGAAGPHAGPIRARAGAERTLRGSLELPYPRDALLDAIVRAAPEARVAIAAFDRDAGALTGRLPTTLSIWSPSLTVGVEDAGEAGSRVSYEARGQERRPEAEERILADVRDRLSHLLRGAAQILDRERVGA